MAGGTCAFKAAHDVAARALAPRRRFGAFVNIETAVCVVSEYVAGRALARIAAHRVVAVLGTEAVVRPGAALVNVNARRPADTWRG
jgi:hypothetical protein